jgi:hypothetical protein
MADRSSVNGVPRAPSIAPFGANPLSINSLSVSPLQDLTGQLRNAGQRNNDQSSLPNLLQLQQIIGQLRSAQPERRFLDDPGAFIGENSDPAPRMRFLNAPGVNIGDNLDMNEINAADEMDYGFQKHFGNIERGT